ncbi:MULTISPECIES: outer membrane beta-barrel protein [Chryseobacterium]|nr:MULTISPECIES: outer membrane beta-barrel protein [Chryseobacterium]
MSRLARNNLTMKKNKTYLYISALFFIGIHSFGQNSTDSSLEKKGDTLNTKEIEEVILKSQKKKQYADRAIYTFGKESLEKARYAKDLIRTLPELKLDPISNTIVSTKGGITLFLVNGVEASDMQIRSIAPNDVVKVEYYDIPPTRWATRADTVVNIITRNPETGYVFGTDVSSALNTGFINGSGYANYTKGKNNLGAEYAINFRDYNNRIVKKKYEYFLNEKQFVSDEIQKDHFGYTNQYITLRYANVVPDKYTFQAKVNFNISSNFVKGNGQSNFSQGNGETVDGTIHNSSSHYVNPVLDLYFSNNLGKKDEVNINIITSHYNTDSYQFDKEWIIASGQDVFNNEMNLKVKQNGFIGELSHIHNFGIGKLNSGYRISTNSISNSLKNLAGYSNYKVNYRDQYVYTEFSGKKEKLMYRLSLGLVNIFNESAENRINEWNIVPKIILGYQLNNHHSLRITSDYKSQSPSSTALSSNVVQLVPNIVQRGNPYLEPQNIWNNNVMYSLKDKYFDLTTTLSYIYINKVVNQYFVADNSINGYALTYENAKNSEQYFIQIVGSVKPFGNDYLVLKAEVKPTSEIIRTKSGKTIKNQFIDNFFSVSSEYKSFAVEYQFNIPVFSLSGAFLVRNENSNHIFANYRFKNWTFTTGMYFIGTPSVYMTKSLDESIVNYTNHRKIYNNKSMFILGLSYDFSTGKKLDIQKKINNRTAPAATF